MKVTESYIEIRSQRALERIDLEKSLDAFKLWELCVFRRFAPRQLIQKLMAAHADYSRAYNRTEPKAQLNTDDAKTVICLDDSLIIVDPSRTRLEHTLHLVGHSICFHHPDEEDIHSLRFGYALKPGMNGFERDVVPALQKIVGRDAATNIPVDTVDIVPCSFYRAHEEWHTLNEMTSRFAGKRYTVGRLRHVANAADRVAKFETRSLFVALSLYGFDRFSEAVALRDALLAQLHQFNRSLTKGTHSVRMETLYRLCAGRTLRDVLGIKTARAFIDSLCDDRGAEVHYPLDSSECYQQE